MYVFLVGCVGTSMVILIKLYYVPCLKNGVQRNAVCEILLHRAPMGAIPRVSRRTFLPLGQPKGQPAVTQPRVIPRGGPAQGAAWQRVPFATPPSFIFNRLVPALTPTQLGDARASTPSRAQPTLSPVATTLVFRYGFLGNLCI